MRLKFVRTLLVLALLGNIIAWHRIWRLFANQNTLKLLTPNSVTPDSPQNLHRRVARLVTVVIRQFEPFENDLASTIESVLNIFPAVTILIVCEELPYPPLELNFANETMQNVKLINMQAEFNTSYDERNPLFYIRTKYVLFLPDGSRLSNELAVQEIISHAAKLGTVSVPIGSVTLNCINIDLRIKEWSLKFSHKSGNECDGVNGKHATMIETKLLRKLTDPFLLPFTDALYIQTTALSAKIHMLSNCRFNEGKSLYKNHQSLWKVQQLYQIREKLMFEKLGIKKVTRTSGTIQWYGCSREKSRCFGSIVNGVPSYLYQNRYTPPCCLSGLRKVAHHVFNQLEEVGIRFWLEGGSLLGAMKNNDILPWDFEVSVGINRDDIERSSWLIKAMNKPVVDNHGFVWEKAQEGNFFKVQYSKINHLSANILPFYAKNGSMVRDGWVLNNRNFPEQFLHPMSTIEFAGGQVPCPNNIRDFLELKYFKGVIENPEIPGKISF